MARVFLSKWLGPWEVLYTWSLLYWTKSLLELDSPSRGNWIPQFLFHSLSSSFSVPIIPLTEYTAVYLFDLNNSAKRSSYEVNIPTALSKNLTYQNDRWTMNINFRRPCKNQHVQTRSLGTKYFRCSKVVVIHFRTGKPLPVKPPWPVTWPWDVG